MASVVQGGSFLKKEPLRLSGFWVSQLWNRCSQPVVTKHEPLLRERLRSLTRQLAASSNRLELPQMIQILAGHGFDDRLEGHRAALGMRHRPAWRLPAQPAAAPNLPQTPSFSDT
ncbi:MAG: hypothetical protein ACLQG3_10355 [Terracidiphilus sp.]